AKDYDYSTKSTRKPRWSSYRNRTRLEVSRKSRGRLDQCALSRYRSRRQAGLLGTNFIFAQRRLYGPPAKHRFFAPGFRPAVLPLVAGGIPRTNGSATLGVGRSSHL